MKPKTLKPPGRALALPGKTPAQVPSVFAAAPTPRLFGRAAVAARRRYLADPRNVLCRRCAEDGRTSAATEVDHIVPLALGGPDTDDNKQPLCTEHHRAKSRDDALRIRQARGG